MRGLIACTLLLLTGCFRLTDPIYTFMPLKAAEPPGPEYSLLIGTVEVEGGFLRASSVDTLFFRRLEPGDSPSYWAVSEAVLYRAFQPRAMRDGHFILAVPPGAYELEMLEETRWPFATRWRMSEGSRVSSRFYITRPGVYDLGVLRVSAEGWGRYAISRVPPADAKARHSLFLEALKGTRWEGWMEEAPREPPRQAPGTKMAEWRP